MRKLIFLVLLFISPCLYADIQVLISNIPDSTRYVIVHVLRPGESWGKEEIKKEKFYIITVTGVSLNAIDRLDDYEGMKFRVDYSAIPQAAKDTLTSTGRLTITKTQFLSYKQDVIQ